MGWRSIAFIGLLLLAWFAAGCGSTSEPAAPTATVNTTGEIDSLEPLVAALRQAGWTITSQGAVEQPFFDVVGDRLDMEGAQIQVFDYPSVDARSHDSEKISSDGYTIGGTDVSWTGRPNFWVQGQLIVLYLGPDPAIIQALSVLLSQPITPLPDVPAAVQPAKQRLSEMLSIPVIQIRLVSYEHVQWRNGCLGLSQPGENCTQAIVPGWQIELQAGGQHYEVHTDESGQRVRVKTTG
jgi:hypothetical protein